jgi:uncharacterized protein YcbK (DUF882 family)
MRSARVVLVVGVILCAWFFPDSSFAANRGKSSKSTAKRSHKVVCKGSGKARKCRRVPRKATIVNRTPRPEELRDAPTIKPSGWVHVSLPARGKDLRVNIYNPDGSFNQAALAALDELWACRRTKEVRAVDPRLYEVLSTINDHYGQPVELMSGFRFQQNEGSRHFHASAMDVRVPGVSYKELFAFAETLDPGGMGIGQYPHLGFVHIDYRAPGQRSVRWTDTSGRVNRGDPGKQPSRSWVRRKPNS